MSPIAHFEAVWLRCSHLTAIHAYLAANATTAVQPDEILRAEWVARIGALDLYIHELVAQKMRAIFDSHLPATPAFVRFQLSLETVTRIMASASPAAASAAFDLDIRERLAHSTFQDPDKIADGIRMISTIELWNEVASRLGATPQERSDRAKDLKRQLSLLVRRRNQIAHEGDLQPGPPRLPWPISQSDLTFVTSFVEQLVRTIDLVVP